MNVKVIFHVDETIKWGLALRNAENLLQLIDIEASKVEILANSEAVKMYKKDSQTGLMEQMSGLSKAGVKLAACSNSLSRLGIKKGDLLDFVEVVPAGVLELIQKQGEGYAYIKP